MNIFEIVLVVAAGILAGFINTLAGSGSLITLPLLIFVGLPADVANATNRVAVLLQCGVGVRGFHGHGMVDWRGGAVLAIPTIFGAILGAQIAVTMDAIVMRRAIGILMIVMLVVLSIKPERWIHGRPDLAARHSMGLKAFVFFLIGVYGGFLQAGVGIPLLAALSLIAGYDLVRANAIKLLIVLIFTAFALGVFILHGQVRWGVGLTLALGNMIGAWIATTTAARKGARFVHTLLIVVVLISGFLLLGGGEMLKGFWGRVF